MRPSPKIPFTIQSWIGKRLQLNTPGRDKHSMIWRISGYSRGQLQLMTTGGKDGRGRSMSGMDWLTFKTLVTDGVVIVLTEDN